MQRPRRRDPSIDSTLPMVHDDSQRCQAETLLQRKTVTMCQNPRGAEFFSMCHSLSCSNLEKAQSPGPRVSLVLRTLLLPCATSSVRKAYEHRSSDMRLLPFSLRCLVLLTSLHSIHHVTASSYAPRTAPSLLGAASTRSISTSSASRCSHRITMRKRGSLSH